MKSRPVGEVVEKARQHWNEVGPNINTVATHFRISHNALAKALGVNRQTLSNWLTGVGMIPGYALDACGVILGVPVEVFHMDPDSVLQWIVKHPEVKAQIMLSVEGTGTRGASRNRKNSSLVNSFLPGSASALVGSAA